MKKWDIDVGKDGRAEIPLPLIQERDGASFQIQHLFLDQDYCAILCSHTPHTILFFLYFIRKFN